MHRSVLIELINILSLYFLLYNWDHFIIIFTLLIKLPPVSVVDNDVRLCVPDDAVVADAVGHQQQGQQQQADQVADNVVLIVVNS